MATLNVNSDGGGVTQNWSNFQGNPTDQSAIAQYVQYLSQQPGADPTLASDPNYWIGKISETGGLTGGNVGYWNDRSKAGAGNAGGGGGQGGSGFQYGVSDFVNGPFGQYALKQAQLAATQGAFSRGLGLSTGAQKDVAAATYGALGQLIPQDYAMQQNQFQTNFGNLNTIANYGYGGLQNAANYGTGAAAAGAAGTVGASNAINQGIGGVGSAYTNYQLYKNLNPHAGIASDPMQEAANTPQDTGQYSPYNMPYGGGNP